MELRTDACLLVDVGAQLHTMKKQLGTLHTYHSLGLVDGYLLTTRQERYLALAKRMLLSPNAAIVSRQAVPTSMVIMDKSHGRPLASTKNI